MQSFSQRKGLKPINQIIQVEGMSEELRNSLWNLLVIYYWDKVTSDSLGFYDHPSKTLFTRMWMYHFKLPIDKISYFWREVKSELNRYFFSCKWYEVYDFIEFIAQNGPFGKYNNEDFIKACNVILVQELSGFRFVDNMITDITSEEEISSISLVLNSPEKFHFVKTHISTALSLYSDRKNPDYRNSIKESISAVEALGKIITGNDKATLGDSLKVIEKKINLHPALKAAFSNLYGYTNDSDGIRHALMDESTLEASDARYMLVSCSAFINYLIEKTDK